MSPVPPAQLGFAVLAVLVAAGLAGLWPRWLRGRGHPPQPRSTPSARPWRPRTPDDCPACRARIAGPSPSAPPPVRPWRDRTSRRGAPRRVATEGYACPARACPYYGITDARVHALVGNCHHGATDRIQDFRCQA